MSKTETEFREDLQELFETDVEDVRDYVVPSLWESVKRVRSFEEALVLTTDEGLKVTLKNGDEFYVTIQKR
jgi:hypothetical protein